MAETSRPLAPHTSRVRPTAVVKFPRNPSAHVSYRTRQRYSSGLRDLNLEHRVDAYREYRKMLRAIANAVMPRVSESEEMTSEQQSKAEPIAAWNLYSKNSQPARKQWLTKWEGKCGKIDDGGRKNDDNKPERGPSPRHDSTPTTQSIARGDDARARSEQSSSGRSSIAARGCSLRPFLDYFHQRSNPPPPPPPPKDKPPSRPPRTRPEPALRTSMKAKLHLDEPRATTRLPKREKTSARAALPTHLTGQGVKASSSSSSSSFPAKVAHPVDSPASVTPRRATRHVQTYIPTGAPGFKGLAHSASASASVSAAACLQSGPLAGRIVGSARAGCPSTSPRTSGEGELDEDLRRACSARLDLVAEEAGQKARARIRREREEKRGVSGDDGGRLLCGGTTTCEGCGVVEAGDLTGMQVGVSGQDGLSPRLPCGASPVASACLTLGPLGSGALGEQSAVVRDGSVLASSALGLGSGVERPEAGGTPDDQLEGAAEEALGSSPSTTDGETPRKMLRKETRSVTLAQLEKEKRLRKGKGKLVSDLGVDNTTT